MKITILGNNSAAPAFGRHPTAQLVQTGSQSFLVDCGEGTQMRMDDFQIKRSHINHILISHLHGDHVLGLVPLLNSYSLFGRTEDLHVYGPPELKPFINQQLELMSAHIRYPLHIHALHNEGLQLVFEDAGVSVYAFPVIHRIPTNGFVFKGKPRPQNVRKEAIEQYALTIEEILLAKNGHNIVRPDGEVLLNDWVAHPVQPPTSYAYSADTIYTETILPYIEGVHLLYHEATFTEDMLAMAEEKFHSTAMQAAIIAHKAGVKRLLLGHYSSRYDDLEPMIKEARSIFPNAELSVEGQVYVC